MLSTCDGGGGSGKRGTGMMLATYSCIARGPCFEQQIQRKDTVPVYPPKHDIVVVSFSFRVLRWSA